MKNSESIKEIVPALVAVQAEMTNVKRNVTNTFFESTYADLGAVLDVVRPILAKNKLAVIQFAERQTFEVESTVTGKIGEIPTVTRGTATKTVVTTRLYHESGEYFETEVFATGEPKNPQEFGSIITYLRRYSILALCCTASEADDDDGALVSAPERGDQVKGPSDKTKVKATPAAKVPTVQEKMDQLPKDLRDILSKIGCNSTADRFHAYQKCGGNLDEMKRLALGELKRREGQA